MRAYDLGEAASRHAGLFGDGRVEDLGRVAARLAGRSGGGAEFADASRDHGLHVRDFARRLLREAGEDSGGEREAVLRDDGLCLGAGGGVGGCGAGSDHVERIAKDVGKHDLEDARRRTGGGEASALDAGEPLADRVDLHDVRAAGE